MARARQRNALAALYAWHSEVRSVVERVSDTGVARIKLDWWRGEIARTLAGEPRHPLSHALASTLAQAQPDAAGTGLLPEAPFLEIIASTDEMLQGRTAPTRDAQRRHDEQDLGALFELLSRCEGGDAQLLRPSARRAGACCAQVRRIRDAGWLLRRARPILTGEQLAAAGLSGLTLASATDRRQLPSLLRSLADELWSEWLAPEERAALTPALRVQLDLHRDLLRIIERSAFDVADQRIGLTPLRKFWLAWRATR